MHAQPVAPSEASLVAQTVSMDQHPNPHPPRGAGTAARDGPNGTGHRVPGHDVGR